MFNAQTYLKQQKERQRSPELTEQQEARAERKKRFLSNRSKERCENWVKKVSLTGRKSFWCSHFSGISENQSSNPRRDELGTLLNNDSLSFKVNFFYFRGKPDTTKNVSA